MFCSCSNHVRPDPSLNRRSTLTFGATWLPQRHPVLEFSRTRSSLCVCVKSVQSITWAVLYHQTKMHVVAIVDLKTLQECPGWNVPVIVLIYCLVSKMFQDYGNIQILFLKAQGDVFKCHLLSWKSQTQSIRFTRIKGRNNLEAWRKRLALFV